MPVFEYGLPIVDNHTLVATACYLFKKVKRFSSQLNSKNNGPVYCLRLYLRLVFTSDGVGVRVVSGIIRAIMTLLKKKKSES